MFDYCTNIIDDTVEIKINFLSCYYNNTSTLRNYAWPTNVSDDYDGAAMVLFNQECGNIIASRPKMNKAAIMKDTCKNS